MYKTEPDWPDAKPKAPKKCRELKLYKNIK